MFSKVKSITLQMKLNNQLIPLILASSLCVGCSTILSNKTEYIKITTDCKGYEKKSVCTVKNSKGIWRFETPAIIEVERSNELLRISCEGGLFDEADKSVKSSLDLTPAGNLIFGGLIGIVVDYKNGMMNSYPSEVNLSAEICKYL